MLTFSKKKIIIAAIILVAIIISVVYFWPKPKVEPVIIAKDPKITVIGKTVQNRAIESYDFGQGPQNLIFVGGIHGGYEWNSVVLAYQFIDYLKANPQVVPANLTISVIPSANPDGVFKVIGKEGRFLATDAPSVEATKPGRFNANNVDLNRNFDCNWAPTAMWQGKTVSAGTAPFSEPEAVTMRDFFLAKKPLAVIFWHSQANAVYASACKNGILSGTLKIMDLYSAASGYPASKTFDSYAVTGAAEDWLASINIPAITVELKTHEVIEWEKNLAGSKALLDYFGKK